MWSVEKVEVWISPSFSVLCCHQLGNDGQCTGRTEHLELLQTSSGQLD